MTLVLFPGTELRYLTPERVRAGRSTRLLGREVLHFPRLGSTNDVARERARAGAAEGLLVLAEEQTSGRGRRGRCWRSPFGGSLLASLLLRPTVVPPGRAFLLTALAGLAVAQAITGETGLEVQLKWPNDLLLDGRKVCGILVDLEGRPGRLDWAVVGWGLNVNVDFSGDAELSGQATSLAMARGEPLPRLPLLRACLERFEVHYGALRAGRGDAIWADWRERLCTLGRPVQVLAPEGEFTGIALDVSPDGALLVRREDGTVVPVLAGDVLV